MGEILAIVLLVWIGKKIGSSKPKKAKKPKKTTTIRVESKAAPTPAAAQTFGSWLDLQPAAKPAEGEGYTSPQSGSLDVESTEGMDLCDPSLEHNRPLQATPESIYAGEIGREPVLDLSSRGIVQGVIMSEVLKRPKWRSR